MIRRMKKLAVGAMLSVMITGLVGCGKSSDEVIIYSNGDEEVLLAIEDALNSAGYENKYILQSFGTSELGGRILAEGKEIEADLVTMSSYYLESANEENKMFVDLDFETNTVKETPKYYSPVVALMGSIFVNTEVMKENNLDMPKSINDLTDPQYKDLIAIPNIMDSSTAWLLVQAIVSEYGQSEGLAVMSGLIENAGAHLESSGSGPIKKVRAGEVAVGFGLRHQAVEDKAEGMPIDYIDPVEGNFSLTESVAVIDKDSDKKDLAMKMAEVIVKEARPQLIKDYPVQLYKGEEIEEKYKATNEKTFEKPLTLELLKEHQEFFKKAKGE